MEKSIYRYILKHSARQQVYLIVLTAASLPLIYVSLEIPKRIINDAIGGANIPESILGIEIGQIDYLIALCCLFLALVMVNGGAKYYLNLYRGLLGERMLRRLRYELYTRILRFPLPHFKRTSAGEIIPMLTAETEPLGGFIGEAFALPAMQGGLLVTYLFFIYNQDLLLGIAATALYPFQLYVIPKLQRRVNELAKQRVLTVRRLADRVGESVAGVAEIHAHDTSRLERADISHRLNRIYEIRFDLYKRKFFIKFLNNFLAQITPFFFYSVGGIFVIQGDLTIGALVAVLAAYKDLASPWAELLKYYQMKEDIRVKYTQIIEQFQPPNLLDADLLDADPDDIELLSGDVISSNLSFAEDETVKIVDGASFKFDALQQVAAVGLAGSGKGEISRLLAGLLKPNGGRLSIGGKNLAELPEAVTGRRIAYVGPATFLFAGTVRDNLTYGLKHRPLHPPRYDETQQTALERYRQQAEDSGNSAEDVDADWIDYQAAGVEDMEQLDWRAIELFDLVEMSEEVYQLGLRSTVDPGSNEKVAQRILNARAELRRRLEEMGQSKLVEPLDTQRYNNNATVAENLLFGTPRGGSINTDELVRHPYVRQTLERAELFPEMLEIGRKVAETMVDLFADLPPGHEFFERFSFISADDLPTFQALLGRVAAQGMDALTQEEHGRLLALAFMLVPARHRLGLIDEAFQSKLLHARRLFRENLPSELAHRIEFFDSERYNAAATVQDNILFGKRVYGQAEGQRRLGEILREVMENLQLRGHIVRVGLDYQVGTAGARLAPTLRQKIGIVRCLLKRPDILIVDEATGSLDGTAEARVTANLTQHMKDRGLVWVLGRAALAEHFEQVMVVDEGRVSEQGSFTELSNRAQSALEKLMQTQS
jgi:ABC-type multidrug transport system fused ATPase/permease subunit